MRSSLCIDDLNDARTLAAAKLVAGVISGQFSPGQVQKWSCGRCVVPLVLYAQRLAPCAPFPSPSAVMVVAGGSPPARTTSPPVDLSWPEPLTCGASLWEIKNNKNKIK